MLARAPSFFCIHLAETKLLINRKDETIMLHAKKQGIQIFDEDNEYIEYMATAFFRNAFTFAMKGEDV